MKYITLTLTHWGLNKRLPFCICILLKKICCIFIFIWRKYVSKGLTDNELASVQVMDGHYLNQCWQTSMTPLGHNELAPKPLAYHTCLTCRISLFASVIVSNTKSSLPAITESRRFCPPLASPVCTSNEAKAWMPITVSCKIQWLSPLTHRSWKHMGAY